MPIDPNTVIEGIKSATEFLKNVPLPVLAGGVIGAGFAAAKLYEKLASMSSGSKIKHHTSQSYEKMVKEAEKQAKRGMGIK